MRAYGDTCPIAAQASQGALALIRTSGECSLELLSKVFSRPKALLDAPGYSIVHGWINDGSPVDEVLVSVYRAPRSYTGEEGADISCHGGSAAVKTVLEILRKAGFQDALPGEFTFRSFMNGKIDLTRSESVMELVSSKTKTGLEHAVKRLSGALDKEITAIRDSLLEAVSAVELYLDYPEDEIDGAETALYHVAAEKALIRLRELSASYRRERLYQEGALAVIVGRPNAGKSSLFNALLNEDRSIVTEIPGTTRDWIEGAMSLDGIPLRLADTAGFRTVFANKMDVSGLKEADKVSEAEVEGIKRSRSLAEEADIILYTVDGSEGLNTEDEIFLAEHAERVVLVWNKADLQEPTEHIRKNFAPLNKNRPPLAAISAKNGKGLEKLCAFMADLVMRKESLALEGGLEGASAGLGTQRQKELTEKAASFLQEALDAAKKEEPLDMIALLLRESLNALGEITGEVSSADILETMFNRFCLGK